MKWTIYCLMLSSLGITTACVDDSYDLSKDIDMTVTVGGDLTTPANSSEDIKIGDLLDIDTVSSDLKVDENGNYVLKVNGDPTNSTIKVNDVTIDGASTETESSKLKFTTAMLQSNGETSAEQIEELNPVWNLKNESVTEDVVDLEYADQLQNNDVSLNLNFKGNTKGVTLKHGLTFTFPSYIKIGLPAATQNDFDQKDLPDGTTQLVLKKDRELTKNGLTWDVKLERIYFTGHQIPEGEGFDGKNHTVIFNVSIPVEGSVTVKRDHFPSGSSSVEFTLVSKVSSKEMTLNRVRAIVDPKIDFEVSDVSITDLPDFLTDNEVNADLENPKVLLQIENSAEVDVNLSGVLHAYRDGVNQAQVIIGTSIDAQNSHSICLKASSKNLLCLSPKEEEVPAGYTWVQVDGMSNLISKIPDLIKVENIKAQILPKFYELNLGVDKNVRTDYDLNAPLEFGRNFNIVYKDTLNGWSDDLDDYEMKQVQVSLNAINRIPLNLEISAEAIDADGNVMPDVRVITDGYVAAPAENEEKSEQKITFTLEKQGDGRIKNLDGLIIRLDGKAFVANEQNQGSNWVPKTLNTNQTLKLDELRLSIKGGVTLDLN